MSDEEDFDIDTFIDGCGTVKDVPIGEGTRIRFRLDYDRQQDVTVFVEDGVLKVYGMYRPLLIMPLEQNHVTVTTKKW